MFSTYLLLCIVSFVNCVPTSSENLKSLDQNALTAFLIPFRESILHKVAVAWNHTITDSAKLQVDMQTCSDQIKASVEKCKTCTASVCQSTPQQTQAVQHMSPTFATYLGLAVSILNPVQYLKEPLNEIGDKLGDVVDLLGSGSESFIHSMASLGSTVGGTFTDAFHGLESAVNTVGDTFVGLGNSVANGFTDFGGSVTDLTHTALDGLTSAGHSIEHFGHNVIQSIGSIFGRKRAAASTIDPQLRQCMAKCASCNALLITDQRQMITSVCGADVVKFNDTVRTNIVNVKGIFTAVSDKTHPVIINIELDPQSLTGLVYGRVIVTANVKGRYIRYQSNVKYDMMNMATSAGNIADEYWQIWIQ